MVLNNSGWSGCGEEICELIFKPAKLKLGVFAENGVGESDGDGEGLMGVGDIMDELEKEGMRGALLIKELFEGGGSLGGRVAGRFFICSDSSPRPPKGSELLLLILAFIGGFFVSRPANKFPVLVDGGCKGMIGEWLIWWGGAIG